jgi:hypothetical protein
MSMKKVSIFLFWMSCLSALIACVYVSLYNHLGELVQFERAREGYGGWFSLTMQFVHLQWYAFLVPAVGLGVGLRFQKVKNEFAVFLVTAFLMGFALIWAFLAIFVWKNQSIGH